LPDHDLISNNNGGAPGGAGRAPSRLVAFGRANLPLRGIPVFKVYIVEPGFDGGRISYQNFRTFNIVGELVAQHLRLHIVLFRLINLYMPLHALYDVVTQGVGSDSFLSDFAQSDNRLFVSVFWHGWFRSGGNLPGAAGSNQNQIEPVRDFINAIFNSNTSHVRYISIAPSREPAILDAAS